MSSGYHLPILARKSRWRKTTTSRFIFKEYTNHCCVISSNIPLTHTYFPLPLHPTPSPSHPLTPPHPLISSSPNPPPCTLTHLHLHKPHLASHFHLPTSRLPRETPTPSALFHIPADKKKKEAVYPKTPLSAHARFARHTPLPIYLLTAEIDACMHPQPLTVETCIISLYPLPRSGVFSDRKARGGKKQRTERKGWLW